MKKSILLFILAISFIFTSTAQKDNLKFDLQSNSIPVTAIIKDVPDSILLEIVQGQTFRFFWHSNGIHRTRDCNVIQHPE